MILSPKTTHRKKGTSLSAIPITFYFWECWLLCCSAFYDQRYTQAHTAEETDKNLSWVANFNTEEIKEI